MRSVSIDGDVARFRVGEAEVAVVMSGRMEGADLTVNSAYGGFTAAQDWRTPTTPVGDDGLVVFTHLWLMISMPDALVVIDPNVCADGPGPHATRHFSAIGIEAALDQLGVTPDEVTHVLISHVHDDHINGLSDGGAPRFRKALHVVQASEWEHEVAGAPADRRERVMKHLGPVEEAALLRLVDGDAEIVPGLAMVHAPGETPGHAVIRLENGGERFYYLADLVHVEAELHHVDWVSIGGRPPEILAPVRRRIFGEATGAVATYTHAAFPAVGTIEASGADSWHWLPLGEQ